MDGRGTRNHRRALALVAVIGGVALLVRARRQRGSCPPTAGGSHG
jgi:hypothetical protein